MKKISLIFAFVLLVVAIFAINVFAAERALTWDDVDASASDGSKLDYGSLDELFNGNKTCNYYMPAGCAAVSGDTATIVFKEEFFVTSFNFYVWMNGTYLNVYCYDANNNVVAYNDSLQYVNVTDGTAQSISVGNGVFIKKVVLGFKNNYGNARRTTFSELEITVPVCEHNWVDATYDAPKTCSLCGKTEGEKLVCTHDWEAATYEVPKTCKICNATDGYRLPPKSFVKGPENERIMADDLFGPIIFNVGTLYSYKTSGAPEVTFDGNSATYWCSSGGTLITIAFENEWEISDIKVTMGGNYSALKIRCYDSYGNMIGKAAEVYDNTDNGIYGGGVSDDHQSDFNAAISGVTYSDNVSAVKYITVENTYSKWGYLPAVSEIIIKGRERIPFAGCETHSFEPTYPTVPTCTTEGILVNKCTVCGAEDAPIVAPALGHNMETYTIKVPATCVSAPVLEFVCSRCGETLERDAHVDNIIEYADQYSIGKIQSGGGQNADLIFDGKMDTWALGSGAWAVEGSIEFDMPYYLSSVTIWIEGASTDAGFIVFYHVPGTADDAWVRYNETAMQVPAPWNRISEYTLELSTPVYADAIRVYVGAADYQPRSWTGLSSYSGRFYEVSVAGSIVPEVAGGHTWEVAGDAVAPTCVAYGYTPYKCIDCDATKEGDFVFETGIHTCSTIFNEEKQNLCAVCGNTYAANKVTHGEWADATCIAAKHCTICGVTEGDKAEHTWADATCTDPKTCSVCFATEGEALGHTMSDATCTTPATCSVCGATEGEALGHTMSAATCTAPATCSVCGATEGKALGHTWADATCTAPKTCSVCGATEGEALGQHIYDLSNAVTDGNVITIACTNGCGAAATITINGTMAQAGFDKMMQQAIVSVYAPGYGMLSATTSEGSSCFLITNPRLPAQSFTAPMIVNIDGFNDTYFIVPQFSATDAAPSITITYEALTPATIVEGENTVDTSAGETKVQFVVTESGKYNFILNADAMVLTEYGAAGTHEGPFAYEAGDIAEIIIMTYGEPSVVITVEKVIEHVHSYTSSVTAPTCEAAGKTVYTCTCGDTYEESIPALGHTEVEIPAVLPTPSVTGYTAGVKCSECGETIKAPVEIIVTTLENERDADLNIGGANLSLQENIAVRYWAKVNTNMYKDHYMVFVFNNEEYVITENAYNNSYKMYGFRFEETFPQKMADNIEAYVYARTADGNYSRNKVLTYSVLQYCTRQLEKNNAALTTMISDVLTYGAMTQMYMNYKTNALVTNLVGDFTLTPTAFTTVPESVNKMGLIGDNTGATKWKGATVLYGSSTYVKILFNTENIDNLVININLAGSDKKFTKEDFKYDTTNKAYYIVVDYIKSYEYDETITATFIENGEQVYSTLTYSINTYIFRNYNKGSNNAQNLLKALYIYGVAISNYKW